MTEGETPRRAQDEPHSLEDHELARFGVTMDRDGALHCHACGACWSFEVYDNLLPRGFWQC